MLYFLHDQVLHTASLWICSFQVSHFHFVFMSKRGPHWSLHLSKTTCMTKQNFIFVKLVKGTSLLSFTENGSNLCYFSSCFSAAFYFSKNGGLVCELKIVCGALSRLCHQCDKAVLVTFRYNAGEGSHENSISDADNLYILYYH